MKTKALEFPLANSSCPSSRPIRLEGQTVSMLKLTIPAGYWKVFVHLWAATYSSNPPLELEPLDDTSLSHDPLSPVEELSSTHHSCISSESKADSYTQPLPTEEQTEN